MEKAKWLKWALAAVLVAALAGGAWVWWPQGGQEAQIQGKQFQVRRGSIRRLVVSTGTVKPQVGAEVKVGARVSGRVEKLLVSIGQPVKAGQVVAVIEHKDLEAKLHQAEAELRAEQARLGRVKAVGPREIARAEAELSEAKATLDLTTWTSAASRRCAPATWWPRTPWTGPAKSIRCPRPASPRPRPS